MDLLINGHFTFFPKGVTAPWCSDSPIFPFHEPSWLFFSPRGRQLFPIPAPRGDSCKNCKVPSLHSGYRFMKRLVGWGLKIGCLSPHSSSATSHLEWTSTAFERVIEMYSLKWLLSKNRLLFLFWPPLFPWHHNVILPVQKARHKMRCMCGTYGTGFLLNDKHMNSLYISVTVLTTLK